MPWAVVLRMLARLGVSLLVWRAASARRNRRGGPGGPLPRERSTGRARLDDDVLRELRVSASVGWRAVSAAAFLVAATVLATAGVTLTVLSPRWLGIALLTFAAASFAGSALEVLATRRLVAARLRRRRDAALRRQVS